MKPALALFGLLFCVTARAEDWPQWRGRDRDGVAHKTRLPAIWPEKPPKSVWKQTIGEGQSSPVIASGRLFLLGRRPDGKEACYCLDAKTGKVLWHHTYTSFFRPSDPTAGVGPKSTPTVDSDRVYMLGAAGMFHCFQPATGKILWKHDLQAEFWGIEKDQWGDDAYSTCCGAAASPLVDGTRVLVPVGGKMAGAMTAFDRRDGKVVWKAPLMDRSSYASPILATLAGSRQIVGFTGLRMVGLNPSGGALLWDYSFPAEYEQTIITPIVWKNRVIIAGERKPTIALEVAKVGGKHTTKTAWSNTQLRCYMSSPVQIDDHIIGLNARKQLVCVDLATGKTVWAGGNFGTYATLVVAGKLLLVLTRDAELHVLEANTKKFVRKATWQLPIKAPTWSHLAVVGSRLYVKDHTDVYCYDLSGR